VPSIGTLGRNNQENLKKIIEILKGLNEKENDDDNDNDNKPMAQ
jgi:hypothetical protein